jgi:putative transposase
VFADRYHAHILKTPREVRRALGYVLCNAEKHYGVGHGVFADPYSSAAWFQGWSTAVRIGWSPLGERAPPISAPDTWLLKTGWKKRGLLDPRQTPS